MELDRYWRERDEAGAENAKPRFVPLEKWTPNIPLVEYERNLRRVVDRLFLDSDAVHPTDLGHAIEAEQLYAQLEASGVLSQMREDAEGSGLHAR